MDSAPATSNVPSVFMGVRVPAIIKSKIERLAKARGCSQQAIAYQALLQVFGDEGESVDADPLRRSTRHTGIQPFTITGMGSIKIESAQGVRIDSEAVTLDSDPQ